MTRSDREHLDEIVRHLSNAYSSFATLPREMIDDSCQAKELDDLIFSAIQKARLFRKEQKES